VKIPTANQGFSTVMSSTKVIVAATNNWKRQYWHQNHNTYTSGTMTDMIKIPTANMGFLTTSSSIKVFPGDYYDSILGDNLATPSYHNHLPTPL